MGVIDYNIRRRVAALEAAVAGGGASPVVGFSIDTPTVVKPYGQADDETALFTALQVGADNDTGRPGVFPNFTSTWDNDGAVLIGERYGLGTPAKIPATQGLVGTAAVVGEYGPDDGFFFGVFFVYDPDDPSFPDTSPSAFFTKIGVDQPPEINPMNTPNVLLGGQLPFFPLYGVASTMYPFALAYGPDNGPPATPEQDIITSARVKVLVL